MSLLIRFLYIFSNSDKSYNLFKNESGVHRFQRIPPTETKGRTHTSTVIVTIIKIDNISDIVLNKKDIKRIDKVGSGPGGQNRNRIHSCVILTHIPTNIEVKIDMRSQLQSYNVALQILTSKVNQFYKEQQKE